jgi:hypothetical protein
VADRNDLVSVLGRANHVDTLAIYYSNLPSAGLRLGLAGVFAAFAVWALWLSRQRHMSVIVIALFLVWPLGGSPSVPRTIVPGGRKSR